MNDTLSHLEHGLCIVHSSATQITGKFDGLHILRCFIEYPYNLSEIPTLGWSRYGHDTGVQYV
jgi:hypothetical protein